jgi:IMP dehydrogenase
MSSIIPFDLTYDDIQLVPAYSEIESRANISLNTQLSKNYDLGIPLIASPMDTVCGAEMAVSMAQLGGVGCIHRFMSIKEQTNEVEYVVERIDSGIWDTDVWEGISQESVPVMAAIGANGDYWERAQALVNAGVNVLLIDVAHGHHVFVKNAIEQLKSNLPSHVDVIAGNIATIEAAIDLEAWGADALRVGIGGGSLCTTRIKTGFGIPNVSSLEDICNASVTIPIIACGGIRNSGDIAKALSLGASSVILGSLLAGTKEAPGPVIERGNGLFKRYRGAASLETKSAHGQSMRNIEGESTIVPFKGATRFVVEGLLDGIRSALSYAGAKNLTKFRPDYVVVTGAGIAEAKPHLL